MRFVVKCVLVLGALFHRQLTVLVVWLGLLGRRAGLIAALLIGGYIAFKYIQRFRFRRELRINRVTPTEALALLQGGHPVTFVDLRNPAEIELEGFKIAGARVLRPAEIRSGFDDLPAGQQAILYCTCPNESTSARVALQLKRAGFHRVRPLAGGFEAWRKLNLPVEAVAIVAPEEEPVILSPDKTL